MIAKTKMRQLYRSLTKEQNLEKLKKLSDKNKERNWNLRRTEIITYKPVQHINKMSWNRLTAYIDCLLGSANLGRCWKHTQN